MITPLAYLFTIVAQMSNPTYKSPATEVRAIEALVKAEKGHSNRDKVNVCVVICYNDRSFPPVDFDPCDFIAIITEEPSGDSLSVKYVSFPAKDTASTGMKDALAEVASGTPLSKFKKLTHFKFPKIAGWGEKRVVSNLLISDGHKKGSYRSIVGVGDLFYVGFKFNGKFVATFEREQTEETWKSVEGIISPLVNAIYKHASK